MTIAEARALISQLTALSEPAQDAGNGYARAIELLAQAAIILDRVWPCGSAEMMEKQGREKWSRDNETQVFAPTRKWLSEYRALSPDQPKEAERAPSGEQTREDATDPEAVRDARVDWKSRATAAEAERDLAREHAVDARLREKSEGDKLRKKIDAAEALAQQQAERIGELEALTKRASVILDRVWPCGSAEMMKKQGHEKWSRDNEEQVFAPTREWLRDHRTALARDGVAQGQVK